MAGFGSGTGGKENLGVAHLRHGGFSYLRSGIMPGCDRCLLGQKGQCEKYDKTRSDCAVGLEAQDVMMRQITGLPWIRPEDSALVEEFVKARIFLFLIDRWTMVAGPFRNSSEGLSVQGVLKMRWVVANSMSRLANQLGLSPEARKNLGLSTPEEASLDLTETEKKFRSVPLKEGTGNGAAAEG